MRVSTVVIGASLLAAGAALGAYHESKKLKPTSSVSASASQPSQPTSTPSGDSPAAQANSGRQSDDSDVRVEMKNVDFHLTDRIVVHIASLEGTLQPNGGQIPVFDDKNSFAVNADTANVTMSTRALTNDLNDFVFAKPDAPLKKLAVTTKGNQLVIKGLLASKADVPFESEGVPTVTPDGMIHIHTTKVKAVHLPVKKLMDVFGIETSSIVNTKKVPGVSVDKDDLILDPAKILPPPPIHGHLTSIAIVNGGLALRFGSPSEGSEASDSEFATACGGGQNFLAFHGGSVRFGRLTMNDTDLELLDSYPADPFDFSIDHYQKQLTAGFAKTTDKGGLCVHMPDLKKIQASSGRQQQSGATGQ
jgi:hypothetical protein